MNTDCTLDITSRLPVLVVIFPKVPFYALSTTQVVRLNLKAFMRLYFVYPSLPWYRMIHDYLHSI